MIYNPKVSEIFVRNLEAKTRIVVNQGGTSSGKTYSILQLMLAFACSEKLHISVCSATFPHLKKGALKDFIDILNANEMYDEKFHNKTDNYFRVGQFMSKIEFFSLDQPGKARGPRRDILFINECNLIPYETFQQLVLRTKKQIFIDYNPADEFHWIYTNVLDRPDCTFIKSTYLDNPFLPESTIKEIEHLKETDPAMWRVYGLGERGQMKGLIYTNWQIIDQFPKEPEQIMYGLDFGFNNPTALVKVGIKDQVYYLQELIYEPLLTNTDLIARLRSLNISRSDTIYADAAEPQRIEEIHRAGFKIIPANKDVKPGLDRVRRSKICVTNSSENIKAERSKYAWKEDALGNATDEPIKKDDHLMDAARYAIHTGSLPKPRIINARII